MAQDFDSTLPASGVTTFPQLYAILRNHFDAVRSNFSGTDLPPSNITGQIQVRNVSGELWARIYDGSSYVDLCDALEELVNARGSAASLAARLNESLAQDGALKGDAPSSDWWTEEAAAVAYVSASSFTVAGDQRASYTRTTSLQLTQGATVKRYVLSSSYDGGSDLTTVNIGGGVVESDLTVVEYGQIPGNEPRRPFQGFLPINPVLFSDAYVEEESLAFGWVDVGEYGIELNATLTVAEIP